MLRGLDAPLLTAVLAGVASLVGCGAASGLLLSTGALGDDSGALGSHTSDASSALPRSDASGALPHDAARDAWSPVCPASAPTLGSSCAEEGLLCEYSGTSDASCDTFSTCSGAVWTSEVPPGPQVGCPPSPNPAACPTTSNGVPSGGGCAQLATCVYSEGYCICEVVVQPEIVVPEMLWSCGPQPGCPPTLARLGAKCSILGTTCTYPPCAGATCGEQGYWQPTEMTCGG
jgi:hypothetical protein